MANAECVITSFFFLSYHWFPKVLSFRTRQKKGCTFFGDLVLSANCARWYPLQLRLVILFNPLGSFWAVGLTPIEEKKCIITLKNKCYFHVELSHDVTLSNYQATSLWQVAFHLHDHIFQLKSRVIILLRELSNNLSSVFSCAINSLWDKLSIPSTNSTLIVPICQSRVHF